MERVLLNRNVRGLSAVLLASTILSPSVGAVVIDNFNVTQPPLTVNAGTPTAGSQVNASGVDILGGQRDMFLQLLSVTTPGNGSVAEVQGANSLLDFSQQATSSAVLTITYDGVDASPGPDPVPGLAFGLGSQDFTLGGEESFALTIGSSEASAQFVGSPGTELEFAL